MTRSSPQSNIIRSMRSRCLTLIALALLLLAGCQSFRERSTKEKSFEPLSGTERAAVDTAVRTGIERCVTIRPAFMTIGSGCLITYDGWILTAEHVVRGRRSVDIELASGASLEGRVVATSAGN